VHVPIEGYAGCPALFMHLVSADEHTLSGLPLRDSTGQALKQAGRNALYGSNTAQNAGFCTCGRLPKRQQGAEAEKEEEGKEWRLTGSKARQGAGGPGMKV